MKQAEKFITARTMNGSNQIINGSYGTIIPHYNPWLTPNQARKAVEIAREEMIEWLENNIYMYNGECENDRTAIINDLKQAMKDECI